jgi:uncharacterized protein with GYD domain
MPKYLLEVSYSPEGLQGVMKDTASGRKDAVQKMIKAAGGKLEAFYYSFGDNDVVVIAELPDNTVVASLSLAMGASGMAHGRTTPLLSVDEMDKAIKLKTKYKIPGAK